MRRSRDFDEVRRGEEMLKVAFICTHNSCRSQIAEAFGRHLCGDVFESYSAGTSKNDQINPDAVRLMKEKYGIDMVQEGQHPKELETLPPVDIVITMGCGVQCPYLPCRRREDWGLEDPTGKSDSDFINVMNEIRCRVLPLGQNL
jgi:arsenate reductase